MPHFPSTTRVVSYFLASLFSLNLAFGVPTSPSKPFEAWRNYPEAVLSHLTTASLLRGKESIGFERRPHTLLVFISATCPLAAKYVGKLNEIAKQFDVGVIGVFSNRGETRASLEKFQQNYNPEFALLLDPEGRLADMLKAERTPESFLLDQAMKIVYRGAIDDQLRVGAALPNVKNDYLRDVLLAFENGTPLTHTVTKVEGCLIGRPGLKDIYPTYARDIGPLVEQHCTYCHRPGDVGGILPLTTIGEISGVAETLSERVTERAMPPWRPDPRFGEFHNDQRLDVNEIWAIRMWAEKGTPPGEGSYEMRSVDPSEKYRLKDPDAIVPMTEDNAKETHFEVPEVGVLPYQHFRVPTDFGEDKWLVASEIRALAPEVVHHINVFVVPPGEDFILRNRTAFAMARAVARKRFNVEPKEFEWVYRLYGPGMRRQLFIVGNYTPSHTILTWPEEHGVLIPRGSELIFECHYTPNGKKTLDRSALALKFAKTVPPKAHGKQSITRSGSPSLAALQIEPNGTKTLTHTLTYAADARLFSLRPHMHLRGKDFLAIVERPDGTEETILYIPKWDYEWQIAYYFKRPVPLPAGTKLRLTYRWDNSAANDNNPDPTQLVRFGTKIGDEMGMAWPTYAYDDPDVVLAAEEQLVGKLVEKD